MEEVIPTVDLDDLPEQYRGSDWFDVWRTIQQEASQLRLPDEAIRDCLRDPGRARERWEAERARHPVRPPLVAAFHLDVGRAALGGLIRDDLECMRNTAAAGVLQGVRRWHRNAPSEDGIDEAMSAMIATMLHDPYVYLVPRITGEWNTRRLMSDAYNGYRVFLRITRYGVGGRAPAHALLDDDAKHEDTPSVQAMINEAITRANLLGKRAEAFKLNRDGRTVSEISAALGIGVKTVYGHIASANRAVATAFGLDPDSPSHERRCRAHTARVQAQTKQQPT